MKDTSFNWIKGLAKDAVYQITGKDLTEEQLCPEQGDGDFQIIFHYLNTVRHALCNDEKLRMLDAQLENGDISRETYNYYYQKFCR